MAITENTNPPDLSMDAKSKDEPLPKDCWPLIHSGNNLPFALDATAQVVALYEEIFTISSRHQGLWPAVVTILNATVHSEIASEMLEAMTPMAQQMRRLAKLDRWLAHEPRNLSEEELVRTRGKRRLGERDALIKAVLDEAAALADATGTAHSEEKPIQERNQRYRSRGAELTAAGMTTRKAAAQIRQEELRAGRSVPREDTIRDILIRRNRR